MYPCYLHTIHYMQIYKNVYYTSKYITTLFTPNSAASLSKKQNLNFLCFLPDKTERFKKQFRFRITNRTITKYTDDTEN